MPGIKLPPPPPQNPENLHKKLMKATHVTPKEFFSNYAHAPAASEESPESSMYKSGWSLFAGKQIRHGANETSPRHDVGNNQFMQVSLSHEIKRSRR